MRVFLFHRIFHLIQQNPTPLTFSHHSTPILLASSSVNPKMAATFATPSTIAGLGSSSLQSSRVSSPTRSSAAALHSSFVKPGVTAWNPLRLAGASGGKFVCFERDWLRTDLNVIGFGLIGWLAPSSIPAINGKSLTGLFFESVGTELAHFPSPPPLTSSFWLWMITWHFGLFLCLTFGQIGFKGRSDGYF
ncbi:photosystem I subunit O [Mangifera indica]|uniref:photosystem I subunit O n=1 Tax=Mangifera indica TaxID=29780 RepID=UPI001CF97537|nr:photosystem I subunit O [Mangifera indica]